MPFVRLARNAVSRWRRVSILAGVLAVLCAVPAAAAMVSGTALPAPSFDGPVYAVAYRGTTVYVGGAFTAAVVDGHRVPRQRLAAFDARTGALLGWAPAADATVRALAVAGSTVYVAGEFGTVGGAARSRLAGLDAENGTVTAFQHRVAGQVATLASGHDRLYVGGNFSTVDGVKHANLAAFTLADGALDAGWAAGSDDAVTGIAVTSGRVYAGGGFHRVNGQSALRLAALDPATGKLDRGFRPNPPAIVLAVAASDGTESGSTALVAVAMGGQGGRAAAYTLAGAQRWQRVFDGDAQAVAVLDGITYVGGHFDSACTTTRNQARGVCSDRSVKRVKLAAISSSGQLTSWAPQANGIVGVRSLAARPLTGTVTAGGEFTTIGGIVQKRVAVFG
ncbi:hypothetical protein ABT369_42725 [Dactylosporangium sp. NPDC000244]|uniref:hypothetical protein n=1 Tax=Dactylosporangium sp. NPDC000244 TaxID=3154365 RepID=UPI00332FBB00